MGKLVVSCLLVDQPRNSTNEIRRYYEALRREVCDICSKELVYEQLAG